VLLVRTRHRHSDAAREEKIAGEASANFDLVAFTAETFDGFEEENFVVSHDGCRVERDGNGSRSKDR
jgi:hypothetical protein